MDLEQISALQYFNTHIRQLSRPQISTLRLQLFNSINGDVFYPIRTWPFNIQQLFWKKPTGDNDTFKLILFFIGNGCSPDVICKWILTSQHWATQWPKGVKRARQLEFIKQNLDSKSNIWFYYDLHHSKWLYLNGDEREANQ